MKLIDKDAVVAEINKLRKTSLEYGYTTMSKVLADTGKDLVLGQLLHDIDTLEVKEKNSTWHNIDDTPNYNLNGISDFIIDSCYGHIYREAHSYTPEQWAAHIEFNANRQFRWAYEKDLIDFD